jgi:hypothetical protein
VLEYLHMTGAVHRLDGEHAFVFRLGDEHVLLVPAPVTGGFPQRLVEDLRCVDLFIGAFKTPPHVVDKILEHPPALGVPEHHARPLFLEVEQVHLAAQLAVVALFGFLQHVQVAFKVSLAGPRGAIDAGQHLVVRVTAPIGAGHLHQLECRTNLPRGCHVRTTAQVEPVALVINLQSCSSGIASISSTL